MGQYQRKPTKFITRCFVRIDGEYHNALDLEPEYRKKIFSELNERAMRAAGYVPVYDDSVHNKETDTNE